MLPRNRVALVQAFTQGIPPRRISARPASRCRDALRPPRHRIRRRGHRTPRTSPSPRLTPHPPMAPFGALPVPAHNPRTAMRDVKPGGEEAVAEVTELLDIAPPATSPLAGWVSYPSAGPSVSPQPGRCASSLERTRLSGHRD